MCWSKGMSDGWTRGVERGRGRAGREEEDGRREESRFQGPMRVARFVSSFSWERGRDRTRVGLQGGVVVCSS